MRENIYGPVNRVKSARLKLDIGSACLCADGWMVMPVCSFSAKPVSGVWYKRVDFVRAEGESFDLSFTQLQETRLPQLAECGASTLKDWALTGLKNHMPMDVYLAFVRTAFPTLSSLSVSIIAEGRIGDGVHGWQTGNEDYSTTLMPATYPPEPAATINGVTYKYGDTESLTQHHAVVMPISYVDRAQVTALYYDVDKGTLVLETVRTPTIFISLYREEHPHYYNPADQTHRYFYNSSPCGRLDVFRKECTEDDFRMGAKLSVVLEADAVADALAGEADEVEIPGEGGLQVLGEVVTIPVTYTYKRAGSSSFTIHRYSHDSSLFEGGRAQYSADELMNYAEDMARGTIPSSPSGAGAYLIPRGLVFFKETTVPVSDILGTCIAEEDSTYAIEGGGGTTKVTVVTRFSFDVSAVPALASAGRMQTMSTTFADAIPLFIKTMGGTEWSIPEGNYFTYGQLLQSVAAVARCTTAHIPYGPVYAGAGQPLAGLRRQPVISGMTLEMSHLIGSEATYVGDSANLLSGVRLGGAPVGAVEPDYLESGVYYGVAEQWGGYYNRYYSESHDQTEGRTYSALSQANDYDSAGLYAELPRTSVALSVLDVGSIFCSREGTSSTGKGVTDWTYTYTLGGISARRFVFKATEALRVEEVAPYTGSALSYANQVKWGEEFGQTLSVEYLLDVGGASVPLGNVQSSAGTLVYSEPRTAPIAATVSDNWLGRAGGYTRDNLRTVTGAVVATQTGEVVVGGETVLAPKQEQHTPESANGLPPLPGIALTYTGISTLSPRFCVVNATIVGLSDALSAGGYYYVGGDIADLRNKDAGIRAGTSMYGYAGSSTLGSAGIQPSRDSLSISIGLMHPHGGLKTFRIVLWATKSYGTPQVFIASFDISVPFPPSVFGAIATTGHSYTYIGATPEHVGLYSRTKSHVSVGSIKIQPVIGMRDVAVSVVPEGVGDTESWYVQYGYSAVSGMSGSVVWAYAKEFVAYRTKCKEWVSRVEFRDATAGGYATIVSAVASAKASAKSSAVQRAYTDLLSFISDNFTTAQKEGSAPLPAKVFEEAAMYGVYRNSKILYNEFASPELLYSAIGASGKAFALLPLSGTIAKRDPVIVTVSK